MSDLDTDCPTWNLPPAPDPEPEVFAADLQANLTPEDMMDSPEGVSLDVDPQAVLAERAGLAPSSVGLGGVAIRVVEPGTEIEDEATGQRLTVTDDTAVTRGAEVFVTQAAYDALKNHPDVATV